MAYQDPEEHPSEEEVEACREIVLPLIKGRVRSHLDGGCTRCWEIYQPKKRTD